MNRCPPPTADRTGAFDAMEALLLSAPLIATVENLKDITALERANEAIGAQLARLGPKVAA